MTEASAGESRRRLSAIESKFVSPPAIVGAALTVRGDLDLAALAAAFDALRREHPELAGRIEQVDGGYDFVVDGSGKPAAELIRVLEQDLEKPPLAEMDLGETLTAIDVLTDEDRHCVILQFSHAAADGTRGTFLVYRLWSLYTRVAQEGSAGELTVQPMPKSPEQVLAEHGVVKGESSGEERLAGARWHGLVPKPEDLPEGELRLMRGRLITDAERVAGLRATAKQLGCSAQGLIIAAVAIAERSAFVNDPDDEVISLGLASTMDIRFKLSPPVVPTEVTNCVSGAYNHVELTCDSDIRDVARQVSAQLRADTESGFLQQAVLQPDLSGQHGPAVAVNYFGDLPYPELPQGLTAEIIGTVFEFDLSQLRKVIALLQPGSVPPLPVGVSYYVGSFANQFIMEVINIPGLISEERRDHILEQAVELLIGVIADTAVAR